MIAVRVDPAGFDRIGQRFAVMRASIPRALSLGLNEGGDKVRTQVQRALKQQTNVKAYSSITKRMRTVKAGPGSLSYAIVATGKGIPIKEFPVHLTMRGVDADTWGVEHLFARSFGIKGEGVGGFRARLGTERYPIRRLYGPALPKELNRGVVPSVFVLSAGEFVPPAIMRQLARVM
jgi:hypothetical protein